MISIKMEIDAIEFDSEAYTERLAQNIQEQMRLAARAFAIAALKRIPTFHPSSGGIHSDRSTGFVSGAFRNIDFSKGARPKELFPDLSEGERAFANQELRSALRKLQGPVRTRRSRGIRQEFYHGVLKTPSSGRAFATPPDKIIIRRGKLFIFNFSVDISYFSIQDVGPGKSPSAPWQAFQAGIEAFQTRMLSPTTKKAIYPKIQEFFVKKTYKVDYKGNVLVNVTKSNVSKLNG